MRDADQHVLEARLSVGVHDEHSTIDAAEASSALSVCSESVWPVVKSSRSPNIGPNDLVVRDRFRSLWIRKPSTRR